MKLGKTSVHALKDAPFMNRSDFNATLMGGTMSMNGLKVLFSRKLGEKITTLRYYEHTWVK